MDGKFIPEADAKVSIYSLDVMQAAAAFEMTRSFNGVHFKLMKHVDRLYESCRSLSLPFLWNHSEVYDLCQEVSARNDHGPGEEHRLLIVVSPGCAPMYRDLDGVIPHPFLYIADFPLRYTVKGFSKYFTEGVHCVTSKIRQVPDGCIPSSAKHRSRLHFHLAQQQAPSRTWPLLIDECEGEMFYPEAPGANIMFVRRGEAKPIACTYRALPGISMRVAMDLTQAKRGILKGSAVCGLSELWLTGTPFCMLPVVSLDGEPIGDGKPGPVFKETLAKWSASVGIDIQEQITRWDSQD